MKSNKTAYEAAMHLLKYRDQSTYELRNKLKIRKYSSEEIEECIHRLLECGYVDDKVLAVSYTHLTLPTIPLV